MREVWTGKNRILLVIKKTLDGIGANGKKALINPTFLKGAFQQTDHKKRAFVPRIWQKHANLAPLIFEYHFFKKITLLFRYSHIPIFLNYGISEYWNRRLSEILKQEYWNIRIFQYSVIPKIRNIGILRYWNQHISIFQYSDIPIFRYSIHLGISEYWNIRII